MQIEVVMEHMKIYRQTLRNIIDGNVNVFLSSF